MFWWNISLLWSTLECVGTEWMIWVLVTSFLSKQNLSSSDLWTSCKKCDQVFIKMKKTPPRTCRRSNTAVETPSLRPKSVSCPHNITIITTTSIISINININSNRNINFNIYINTWSLWSWIPGQIGSCHQAIVPPSHHHRLVLLPGAQNDED